jgi:hypothetical protein
LTWLKQKSLKLRLLHREGRKDAGHPGAAWTSLRMSLTILLALRRLLSTWKRRETAAGGRERIVIRDMERLKAIAAGGRLNAPVARRGS